MLLRDVRSGDSYSRLEGHREEVCGLKWSCDGHHLATGGNDNKVRGAAWWLGCPLAIVIEPLCVLAAARLEC